MTPQLYRACERAAHVITAEGQILKAGRATLFILGEIGYPAWLIRLLNQPPLVWLVELGYAIVARNRGFFAKFLFTRQ